MKLWKIITIMLVLSGITFLVWVYRSLAKTFKGGM